MEVQEIAKSFVSIDFDEEDLTLYLDEEDGRLRFLYSAEEVRHDEAQAIVVALRSYCDLLEAARREIREQCGGCRWSPPDANDMHVSELADRPCKSSPWLRAAIQATEGR